jgi:hypothetical protein
MAPLRRSAALRLTEREQRMIRAYRSMTRGKQDQQLVDRLIASFQPASDLARARKYRERCERREQSAEVH